MKEAKKIVTYAIAIPIWYLIMWGLPMLSWEMIKMFGVIGVIVPLGIGIYIAHFKDFHK